ncbi:MAG: co-chaperone GroES [Chloroflexi bacterium]|nr:co-chaperone GroES [Chloroflexota bacterium]
MGFTLRPLGDRVVIKPVEQETQLPSGIVLPETASEKPQLGEVLAVGPGRKTEEGKRIPLDVSVGQKVTFPKYAGTELRLNGETYLIMREEDILAIVEEE